MDAYLEARFTTYRGVRELIQWCSDNSVLFMINTTAAIGFFQRVFAKDLLPRVPALSGDDMIVFPSLRTDPDIVLAVHETSDKAKNTKKVADRFGISPENIIIIGDSGGDGPHFEWGASAGCCLIGSMTKASLQNYCNERGIEIDVYFGIRYEKAQERDLQKEMEFDFMELRSLISKRLIS